MRSRPRPRRSRPPAKASEALSVGPIRVRMGVHTGRPHVGREGYVGEDVHLAARIAAAGHGGQVLVSQGDARARRRGAGGSWRAPGEGLLGAGVDLPVGGGALSAAEDDLEHESAAAGVVVRGPGAGGGGRGRAAAGRRAAGDAVRPGRFGEDAAGDRVGGRAGAGVPERRLLDRAGRPARPGPRRRDRRADVGRQGRPGRAHRRARAAPAAGQLRAGGGGRSGAPFAARVLPEPPPLGDEPGAVACPGRGRVSRWRRWRSPRRSSSSAPAPGSSRATTSRSSAAGWTTCLSRSSSPRPARASSPRPRSWSGSRSASISQGRTRCRGAAADAACHDRMEPRAALGRGEAAVRQALRVRRRLHAWKRPRPSATPTSTRCSHSSTRASSATRRSASGCSRRSASSRSSDSRRPAALRSCGSGTAPYFLELAELARPRAAGPELVDLVRPDRSGARQHPRRARRRARTRTRRRRTSDLRRDRHFWWTRGYWSEGRRWLESALAAGTESDPQLRFEPLWGAGLLAIWQGDVERGSAVAEEMLALAAERRSPAGGGDAHGGNGCRRARRPGSGGRSSTRSRRGLRASMGDSGIVTIAVNNLGDDRALPRGLRARAGAVRGSPSDQPGAERSRPRRAALLNLGSTTWMLGDLERAREAAARRSGGGA